MSGNNGYLYYMSDKFNNAIYEPDKGQNFRGACRELKEYLKTNKQGYKIMQFNEITVIVSSDSNEDDLAIIYELKRKIQQLESK